MNNLIIRMADIESAKRCHNWMIESNSKGFVIGLDDFQSKDSIDFMLNQINFFNSRDKVKRIVFFGVDGNRIFSMKGFMDNAHLDSDTEIQFVDSNYSENYI